MTFTRNTGIAVVVAAVMAGQCQSASARGGILTFGRQVGGINVGGVRFGGVPVGRSISVGVGGGGTARAGSGRTMPLRPAFNVNSDGSTAGAAGGPAAPGGLPQVLPGGPSLSELGTRTATAVRQPAADAQPLAAPRSFASDMGFVRRTDRNAAAAQAKPGHLTRAAPSGMMRQYGAAVRGALNNAYPAHRGWFGTDWIAAHGQAWRPSQWSEQQTAWARPTEDALTRWLGGDGQPRYLDYGNTLVYEGDTVYNGPQRIATAAEYFQQAREIAARGAGQPKPEQPWQPLGVWAVVQGGQTEANKILQLAVDPQGFVRGNYYDVLTDEVTPIQGAADRQSQRVAFAAAKLETVAETGVYNLASRDETQLLVHTGQDSTRQWTLVRLTGP